MTPEKALEILELNVKEVGSKMPADTLEALIIGITSIRFRMVYDALGCVCVPTEAIDLLTSFSQN